MNARIGKHAPITHVFPLFAAHTGVFQTPLPLLVVLRHQERPLCLLKFHLPSRDNFFPHNDITSFLSLTSSSSHVYGAPRTYQTALGQGYKNEAKTQPSNSLESGEEKHTDANYGANATKKTRVQRGRKEGPPTSVLGGF